MLTTKIRNNLTDAKNHLDSLMMIANSGLAGSFSRHQNEIYAAKDSYYAARIEMLNGQISELERAKAIITREHSEELEARNVQA